ncbi:MAG: asparaginase [Candidatus Aenigmarchaeota archaeon]|nr:asparaginase [Candidatus Aenigmarchaeota archaeon]
MTVYELQRDPNRKTSAIGTGGTIACKKTLFVEDDEGTLTNTGILFPYFAEDESPQEQNLVRKLFSQWGKRNAGGCSYTPEALRHPHYSVRDIHAMALSYLKNKGPKELLDVLQNADLEYLDVLLEDSANLRSGEIALTASTIYDKATGRSPLGLTTVASQRMEMQQFQEAADMVYKEMSRARSVVSTVGTDRMADFIRHIGYMIHFPNVPIVLTGANELPDSPDPDGFVNYANAVLASQYDFAGTVICFGGGVYGPETIKLLPGTSTPFFGDALAQIREGELADISPKLLRENRNKAPELYWNLKAVKNPLTLSTTTSDDDVREYFESLRSEDKLKHEAVLLIASGDGNAGSSPALIKEIKMYTKDGGLVVIAPEEGDGKFNPYYSAARAAIAAGAIHARTDRKAARIKLSWGLGQVEHLHEMGERREWLERIFKTRILDERIPESEQFPYDRLHDELLADNRASME